MRLHQAVYGAAAGHALLQASDAALATDFRNVAWRTDLPQTCPAGVEWAPYFRLIKEAGWMMLIHTRRDAAADRGGMVLSRAAFIPLEDVETLRDLAPVVAVLASPWSEGDSLEPIELTDVTYAAEVVDASSPPQSVVSLATALSQVGPRPLVVCQGQGLEEVMFDLWRRAPPEYRVKLTFGFSFGPTDVHELAVVSTPVALISRWMPAQVIDLRAAIVGGSHAATILDSPADASVRNFAKECGLRLDSDTAISIAVQAFDLWRQKGSPNDELLLLRLLIDASNKSAGAEAAKSTAAKRVLASAVDWTMESLMVMRNLDFSELREEPLLSDALRLWVAKSASSPEAVGLKQVLIAWISRKPKLVWLQAVEAGFRASSDARLIRKRGLEVVWQVLVLEAAGPSRLLSLLADDSYEKQLLEVVDESMPVRVADSLVVKMLAKNWWQLSGVLLARSRPPGAAAKAVLALAPVCKTSRQLLFAGALSIATDDELVDVAIAIQDPSITALAAEACVRNPSVLQRFDWKRFEWFLVLKKAFELSPAVLDALPARVLGITQTIAAQIAVDPLWAVVASTPLANIVDIDQRARAWDLIPLPHINLILDATARGWLDRFERGQERRIALEPRLCTIVVSIVKRRGYLTEALKRAPAAFMAYLEDFCFETDREVYDFLMDLSSGPLRLNEAAAKALGQLIFNNKWHDVATDAKNLLTTRSDLAPLYRECFRLLSIVDRLWVTYKIGLPPPLTSEEAWEAFEAEAVALYSTGPWHDELWSRSGGDSGDLSNEGSGRASWHRCIRSLRNGMAPGAEAVLREMASQYPYNDTLRQLKRQGFWR